MADPSPKSVAEEFGIASALAIAAMALPFVPEAILGYAGYRYLHHFTYGWRTWRAPARIPLHLGKCGYRDETTRRRGDATWPVGTAAAGQVWLRREDLVQGVTLASDDPAWQAGATANLVFGACLHRMGAIIVQSAHSEMLTDQIAEVAKPFGRDRGIVSIDFRESPRPPLRITTSTLAAAIDDLRLGPEANAINKALLPILGQLAFSSKRNALSLYGACSDSMTFQSLIDGEYVVDGIHICGMSAALSSDTNFGASLDVIKGLSNENRHTGLKALTLHARELTTLTSVSLTGGVDLRTALTSGSLVIIRPSSVLTTALVVASCNEALSSKQPGEAKDSMVHIAYPNALSGISAKRFHAAAVKAGSIGALSLPVRPANHVHKVTRKLNALRIQSRKSSVGTGSRRSKMVSALKECSFALDIVLPKVPASDADTEL